MQVPLPWVRPMIRFPASGKRGEASLTLRSGHTGDWWECRISSAFQWALSRVCRPGTMGFLPTPGWESQSLQPHRCGQLAPAPNTVASPHCSFCEPPVQVPIPPQHPHPNQNKTRVICGRGAHRFMYAYSFMSGSQLGQQPAPETCLLLPICKMGSEPGEMQNCSMFSGL